MKIIFVTSEQFYTLWNKLLPSQRDSGGLTHPAIVLRYLDTLVLLHEGVEVGSIEAWNKDPLTLQWFDETVSQKKYFEVG